MVVDPMHGPFREKRPHGLLVPGLQTRNSKVPAQASTVKYSVQSRRQVKPEQVHVRVVPKGIETLE